MARVSSLEEVLEGGMDVIRIAFIIRLDRYRVVRNKWQRAGFTLIELLTVIAILALLATMLLPALSRAKSQAHTAKCISNLRQIGIASSNYIQDHQTYPVWLSAVPGVVPPPQFRQLTFWADLLQSYIGCTWTGTFYRCAGYPGQNTGPYAAQGGTTGTHRGSYDMNAVGVSPAHMLGPGLKNLMPPRRSAVESEVVSPSNLIVYGDSSIGYHFESGTSHLSFWDAWVSATRFNGMEDIERKRLDAKRHSSRYNIAFGDAHVETIRRKNLYDLAPESTRRWNRDNEPHTGEWTTPWP
jgi:prepilin-type N-terminal cleavage/methylation domain-containing protein/prepilin-type processing-associated H-X9-DG protein